MVLPELGVEGQLKLKNSTALIVGAGALGSPVALYLAAAGIGKLIIVDADKVEVSNLHRQVLHQSSAIGEAKTKSACKLLADLNPKITIETHTERLTPDNARELASGCDAIFDGSDNFPTRFLTCDVGYFLGIPVVHGAIDRFQGQVSLFHPKAGGPCYRCLLPSQPAPGSVPSCQEAGVIGALPGVIGSMMALEGIKYLTGIGESLVGKLLVFDSRTMQSRTIRLRKDPDCALCSGERARIRSILNPETTAAVSCAANDEVTVAELHDLIAKTPPFILDVREPSEHEQSNITGAALIPLGQLSHRYRELPGDRNIIIHCKSGGRSAQALAFLRSVGFRNARHLAGGINAWNSQSS